MCVTKFCTPCYDTLDCHTRITMTTLPQINEPHMLKTPHSTIQLPHGLEDGQTFLKDRQDLHIPLKKTKLQAILEVDECSFGPNNNATRI